MARRDIGTDDPRVRVRPGRGSRPRTKQRPSHSDAVLGMVTRIDRGHYRIRLDEPGLTEDSSGNITAMKARELGRGKVVVGDRVAVVGDTSGRKGTLARMVRIEERTTLLRRSAEDGDGAGTERAIVANADKLVIVTAVADPEPRPRMIDRYLVAAYDAGMEPLIVLTKTDLADAAPLTDLYSPLGVRCLATRLRPHGPETGPSQADDGPSSPHGAVHSWFTAALPIALPSHHRQNDNDAARSSECYPHAIQCGEPSAPVCASCSNDLPKSFTHRRARPHHGDRVPVHRPGVGTTGPRHGLLAHRAEGAGLLNMAGAGRDERDDLLRSLHRHASSGRGDVARSVALDNRHNPKHANQLPARLKMRKIFCC